MSVSCLNYCFNQLLFTEIAATTIHYKVLSNLQKYV